MGLGSGIRDPGSGKNLFPSRIPDPGVKKAPDPGSGSATLIDKKTVFYFLAFFFKHNNLLTVEPRAVDPHCFDVDPAVWRTRDVYPGS